MTMQKSAERGLDDRRYRLACVDERHVLMLFQSGALVRAGVPGGDWRLAVPHFPNMPYDADVISVRHNWEARCFEFLIRHPDFEPIPEAQLPPRELSWIDCVIVDGVRPESRVA